MPHSLIKDYKSNLSGIVGNALGRVQSFVYDYADDKILELEDKFRNECPPPAVLQAMIRTINNLNNVINKYESKTNKYSRLPRKLDKPIKVGKRGVDLLTHLLKIPTTLGIPPGPAGGVIFSTPTGVVTSLSNILVWLRKMIETLEDDKIAITEIISETNDFFDPIKERVDNIRTLIDRCLEDPDLTNDERDKILEGAIVEPSLSTEEYLGANGKVYSLEIALDPNSPPVAPRRQAIAKDFRGIVILKGPFSFASDPQVLLDQLKFRIDNQLP
tara:strand:- start:3661 stop:4479 length:819 start_codon:yes stop_codon:yes gene_type:complete